jgi:hypothetical protein
MTMTLNRVLSVGPPEFDTLVTLSRVPIAGEHLSIRGNTWVVQQVIHMSRGDVRDPDAIIKVKEKG